MLAVDPIFVLGLLVEIVCFYVRNLRLLIAAKEESISALDILEFEFDEMLKSFFTILICRVVDVLRVLTHPIDHEERKDDLPCEESRDYQSYDKYRVPKVPALDFGVFSES